MTRLINLVLYQAGWFACVLGAARGHPWIGGAAALSLVAVHALLARERARELRLLVAASLIGAVLDSLQVLLGTLRFETGQPVPWLMPPWILVMWAQFATLLRFSLGWLLGRAGLAALLGAAGGPVAFLAGERLGAVRLHPETWPSLLSLAAAWAIAMALLTRLAGTERGAYRGFDGRGGQGKKALVRST